MGERPPVLIGERVLWLGSGSGLPKGGKVKWIGRLPEMGPDWAVGLELDEALPYGGIDGTWRHRKLFMCQHKHGLIVPRSSVILQPHHTPGETFVTNEDAKKRSKDEPRQQISKPISKVSKLIRALSSDESTDRETNEHLELPSTHLRNRNLERQLSILGTLRRGTCALDLARLEIVKSEACLYSATLDKEENALRRRRRMINGREFKRSESALDRVCSINSSRSGFSSKKERSSGLFSFFRWFKKDKSDVDSDLESPPSPSSPVLNHKDYSISGSVDTLFSTATARSFAFIAPSQYKPFGGANPPELRITSEPETNTYKTRIQQRDILLRQGKNITFKEKYNLHSGDTLPKKDVEPIRRKRRAPPPPETKTDSISESSLPAVLLDVRVNTDRQHRRTQSEPSQSGHPRPCHKKGKRRAPLPPLIIPEGLNTLSLRKKRPAPLPPVQRSTSDDIEPSENGAMSSQNSLNRWETLSTASTVDISQADVIATDTLKLERGYLRSNKDDKPMELKYGPTSPVSPRPWYKRTATRDNSFSRSNERKRDRDKRRVEDWMIESGIPRRPNLLSESKINVFTKLDKNDDKRRSQISILTNISELDREAAEIVQKNKAKEKALLDSKDDKFYTDNRPVNGYFEQPFESRGNFSRDLITLFDSMAKATNSVLLQDHHMERPTKDDQIHRVVLDEQEIKIVDVGKNLDINSEPGPSGQGKIARVTIEELDDFDKERNSKAQALYEARLQRAQSPVIPAIKEVSENATTPNEEPALPGPSQSKTPQAIVPAHRSAGVVVWNCPRCTLENPRWKITCEACDMWRPVSCEFKEVNPKHPLPLAVLRIVEPKDEISTDKKSDSSKTDKTSNALTISDLLFNTGKENFNIKNTMDDSVVTEEKITNVQRTTTPQTKPTPSASESSISSLSSNNSELCQNIPVRAELEEIRKARLAFLDKLCSSNADKIDDFDTNNQKDVESVELAKLKTKFISVDDPVKTNDKCDNVERESSVKNMETSTDLPYKPSYSYEDDKRKLKEMLKEMKHSLPKRPKDGPIQNTSGDSSKCGNGASPQHRPVTRYTHPSDDKTEIYLVESETIIEEIKVRKSPEKESSAPQKGAIVRQIVPATKPTLGDEITVPITVEEYTIKDGVLYTSISKKTKKIGTGAFQLLRPRDFANIRQIKRKGVNGEVDKTNPVYVNVNSKDEYDNNVKQRSYDVEKLSLQLTQPQGLAHFRAGLANNSDSANVNTLAVNRLLRRLENAIANGQHESAAALAKELSQLKVNCVVTRQKPETLNSQILVEMFVEDKQNHQGPFNLYLKPSMTLEELKHKVEKEYEIPRDVQRWIIGKALANDNSATLESMGIVEDGSAIFLYLVVPDEQHLPVSDADEDEEELEGAVGGVPLTKFTQKVTVQTGNKVHEEAIKIDVREVKPSTSTSSGSSQIQKENKDAQIPKLDLDEREIGWACPRCTLVNDGATQRCAACGSRPGSGEETRPLDGSDNKQTTRAEVVEEKKLDYQQLVDLDKSDLIICKEAFECPVCLVEYDPNEGIVLRECLHVFCRGCLANTVEYSEEAEVKCPYRDETYTCDSTLLEREIKALVEPNVYEQHLAKSIALAETKIGNAFHCKTPDCKGWCIFEDNVNLFKCPVCTHTNCLTCQAVHEGLDCKQYQERINVESEINVESRRTKEMLQEMVDRGEAMNCPTCQVVLMKKWGCDWLRCSMCKTEICWITRGPRWGPNGKGDTSGGCQCGVNGVKCHPKCTYCH